MSDKTVFLDLFSGIGGFALAAYRAGLRFHEHYFSEVEPYAVNLYQKRFPDAIPLGDITKVDFVELRKRGGMVCDRRISMPVPFIAGKEDG